MFAIRIVNGLHQATNYHAYAYSVYKPHDCTKDHPTITVALEKDISPHPIDHRAINIVITDQAFVMNEAGKTIDRIESNFVRKNSVVSGDPIEVTEP